VSDLKGSECYQQAIVTPAKERVKKWGAGLAATQTI
jgi:hypothetical protein